MGSDHACSVSSGAIRSATDTLSVWPNSPPDGAEKAARVSLISIDPGTRRMGMVWWRHHRPTAIEQISTGTLESIHRLLQELLAEHGVPTEVVIEDQYLKAPNMMSLCIAAGMAIEAMLARGAIALHRMQPAKWHRYYGGRDAEDNMLRRLISKTLYSPTEIGEDARAALLLGAAHLGIPCR